MMHRTDYVCDDRLQSSLQDSVAQLSSSGLYVAWHEPDCNSKTRESAQELISSIKRCHATCMGRHGTNVT